MYSTWSSEKKNQIEKMGRKPRVVDGEKTLTLTLTLSSSSNGS
jgi:hypothetical protein